MCKSMSSSNILASKANLQCFIILFFFPVGKKKKILCDFSEIIIEWYGNYMNFLKTEVRICN